MRDARDWRFAAIAVVLAMFTLLLSWGIAVPSGLFVCPAIDPPPTNCLPAYRAGTGLVMSIGTAIVLVVALIAALRQPKLRVLSSVGLVVLVFAPFVSYALIALMPGFPLP